MQKQPSTGPEIKFCRLNLSPQFPIVLMREDKWYSSFQVIAMLHFHNCLQIGYCSEGQGYTMVNGVLYPYEKHSISIIPAKALHFCTSQRNTVSRWQWLYVDLLGLLPRTGHGRENTLLSILYGKTRIPYTIDFAQNPQIIQLVRCMIFEMEREEQGYQEVVEALARALATVLVRLAEGPAGQPPESSALQLIAPAVEHISLHYMEPLKVPQLAQLCHISPTHLRRMFQKIMDCSPLEYLQLTRLEAACALLTHTDISVLEAGSQAGFSTGSSFTRQFKKTFGAAPGQWRAANLQRGGPPR